MSILGEYGDKILNDLKGILSTNKKQHYADCIIRNPQGEILLLQRSYQDDFQAGKWCLAGGKIEQGEAPEEAVVREIEEETLLNIKGNVRFLKTVKKANGAIINYFESILQDDTQPIVLDNEEHYRYEFVPAHRLDRYDMLLDLGDVMENELLPMLSPVLNQAQELVAELAVIDANTYLDHSLINKSFDAGLISEDDFLQFQQHKESWDIIKAGYDQDLVSDEQFFDLIEKAKHYEFVQVNRDGKRFYQYREVGTDKVEEDVEVGTEIPTNAILDLKVKKYSEKAILITGDTYKNLALLRQMKAAAGIGSWNGSLRGWIFPLNAKDKIIGLLAEKMSIDTYDETVQKEQAIDLKNTVDIGTEVEVDGEKAEVVETSINEEGKVELTVETKEPEKPELTKEQKIAKATILGRQAFLDGKKPIPYHDPELMKLLVGEGVGGGKAIFEAWSAAWVAENLRAPLPSEEPKPEAPKPESVTTNKPQEPFSMMQDATGNEQGETIDDKLKLLAAKMAYVKKTIEEAKEANDPSAVKEYEGVLSDYENELKELVKQKINSLPIGSISPDGNYIKTADGWEYIKKEKKVTEEEVVIPPADDNKAEDLINNATEENRFKTGKELMGKEEGEKPVSDSIQSEGEKVVNAPVKEFVTRSGEKIQALDYSHITQSDIQLVDQEGILDRPKPNWCVDINENTFAGGYREDLFVFDYVQLEGEKIILATNGYNKDVWGRKISEHVITKEDLRQDLIDKKFTKEEIENANIWGTPERGYSIEIAGNKYVYSEETKKDWQADREALLNNHVAQYAVVSIDQLVAMQDYYIKKRKAEIEKKKKDETEAALKRVLTWDQKKLDYYYPFDYERRLSEKQRKKYTKEQWEALPIEEKVKEIPSMKKPAISLPAGRRITPLSDNKMLKTNFEMYEKFVDKGYMRNYFEKEPYWTKVKGKMYYNSDLDPCAKEYNEVRDALQWRKVDLQVQREENDASYDKALQTSYGDTNMKDDLLESHGVRVKLQNGKEIKANHVEQIRNNLSEVYGSFGDRSEMAKKFGLKISHAGDKLMFARKAMGIYIPSMKAIGVSDKTKGQFGFTLGHEFAHFMDNYVGKQQGRNYASDSVYSTAGKIVSTYRRLMNKQTESAYINRSCECFARAFEQYHAVKTQGHEDAEIGDGKGTRYFEADFHVSKSNFDTHIKPLIEQFLSENDHLLKAGYDELNLIDINNGFELIKAAFDEDEIGLPEFLDATKKYDEIVKGDPSHGGKLVKKTIMAKTGKKETVWVKREDEKKDHDQQYQPSEPVKHSPNVLGAFAKETPAAKLKQIINESSDEKLRAAAHAELDRRDKKEKPQDKKEPAKKKDEPKLEEKKEVEDGKAKPVKIKPDEDFKGKLTILKNSEKAPNMGARYGQDVEPSGFYCIQKETDHLDEHPNYKTFSVDIKKPLIVDVTEDLVQWKRDLSDKYKAKGKKLSEKLKKEGYDSIITTDKYGYTGEIIVLDTEKLNEIDMKKDKKK